MRLLFFSFASKNKLRLHCPILFRISKLWFLRFLLVRAKDRSTNLHSTALRHFGAREDPKQQGHDSMDPADQWRFTPLLEHNSFGFTPLPSQPAGLFGMTPGTSNAPYHSQAGDLHTPGLAFQLGTPLSLPQADTSIHPGSGPEMQSFHPPFLTSDAFNSHHIYPHQPSYTPSSFVQGGGHLQPHGLASDSMGKHSDVKYSGHPEMDSLGISGSNFQSIATMPNSNMPEPYVSSKNM